jgi:hypothetical protein
MADSASRTSSSLNGLMIAVTIFIFTSPCVEHGNGCRTCQTTGSKMHQGAMNASLAPNIEQKLCHGRPVWLGMLCGAIRERLRTNYMHELQEMHTGGAPSLLAGRSRYLWVELRLIHSGYATARLLLSCSRIEKTD